MVYIFELNKRYDIDGSVKYNHARLINHSCSPNCEVEIDNNEIWILAIKKLKGTTSSHIIMAIHTMRIMLIIYASAALLNV